MDSVWLVLSRVERAIHHLSDGSPRSRLIICALAALILFIRIPATFLAPQFWAEDSLLISDAYNNGWLSLLAPLGGAYFNLYGNLIANLAVQFPPLAWPWIAIYGAHVAALLVVFMITSPRFDFPYRAIAALAVVAVPMYDIFGGLANAQWVLALAVFILPILRAGPRWMLLPEAALAFVLGHEGPFVAFVLPIYAWRLWTAGAHERPRLIVLGAISCCCAAIQVLTIYGGDAFNLIEPKPYDKIVWLTMPVRWFDWLRLAAMFERHPAVIVPIAIGLWALVVLFASRRPYRGVKIAMVLFASLILYAGLYKYSNNIVLLSNDRYVFAGAVFTLWFMCLAAAPNGSRRALIIMPILAMLLSVSTARRANQFNPKASVSWTSQADKIGKGPVVIPIPPENGWAISLHR